VFEDTLVFLGVTFMQLIKWFPDVGGTILPTTEGINKNLSGRRRTLDVGPSEESEGVVYLFAKAVALD
jgi:hypothetical protein